MLELCVYLFLHSFSFSEMFIVNVTHVKIYTYIAFSITARLDLSSPAAIVNRLPLQHLSVLASYYGAVISNHCGSLGVK